MLNYSRRLQCFEEPPFIVIGDKMDIEKHLVDSAKESIRDEIEKAITNAKRTELDKWWRRQFYKEFGRFGKLMKKKDWHAETVRPRTQSKRRWRRPEKSHGHKSWGNTFHIKNKTNGGNEHDKRINQNTNS